MGVSMEEVRAGQRDKRLTLQAPNTNATPDAAGHVDLTLDSNWTTLGKRWAAVVTKAGRESHQANQAQADHAVTCVFASDNLTRSIAPEWRILLGPRKLQIVSAVDENCARRRVVVDAVEVR